jgi:hypothetical protein
MTNGLEDTALTKPEDGMTREKGISLEPYRCLVCGKKVKAKTEFHYHKSLQYLKRSCYVRR